MRVPRWSAVGFALALMASCTATPTVSDTGYQGTWSRGDDRTRSTVAIVVEKDVAWFRWSKRSGDGSSVVRCGWDGHCEEFWKEKKVAEYEFRAWIEPSDGKLRVEASHKLLEKDLVIHWIDELEVVNGGKTLSVATRERDSTIYRDAGPRYGFEKVADLVTDPPTGLSGGTNSPLASRTH